MEILISLAPGQLSKGFLMTANLANAQDAAKEMNCHSFSTWHRRGPVSTPGDHTGTTHLLKKC